MLALVVAEAVADLVMAAAEPAVAAGLVLAAGWLTWAGGRALGPEPSRGCARAPSHTRAAVPSPSAYDARTASLRLSLRKWRAPTDDDVSAPCRQGDHHGSSRASGCSLSLFLCCRAPSCREDRSRLAPALKDWWPEHATPLALLIARVSHPRHRKMRRDRARRCRPCGAHHLRVGEHVWCPTSARGGRPCRLVVARRREVRGQVRGRFHDDGSWGVSVGVFGARILQMFYE